MAKGTKLQPAKAAPKMESADPFDVLMKEWKFFIPEAPLVSRILELREELGDSYFEHEYKSFEAQASNFESHGDLQEASTLLENDFPKKGLLQQLFDQVSTIFGFAGDENPRNESVAIYQSFISETIYDHLAMLGRSPGTMRGRAYSIRQELTEGIAEEIGLGLYLTPEISEDLHDQSETVLLKLAGDYQNWFLADERQGKFETTWGFIYSSERELTKEERNAHPLILIPDVDVATAAA